MKIAVTATGPELDAAVDPRFGRCPFFLIVDTDTLEFEALENPNLMLGGGAGIQSAQLMSGKGAKFVLTGNCGPNAYQTLSAAGIEVIIGCSGAVADVVKQFNAGQLNATGQPNVGSKSGIAGAQQPPMTGRGMGMGRGGGRGMGGGMGRGQGMGVAFSQEPAPMPQPTQKLTKNDELAMLKQQAEAMIQQSQQIQERIKQLQQED